MIITLIVNLFSCKSTPTLLDVNDVMVELFDTETLQEVTIGFGAYNEVGKDIPSELFSDSNDTVKNIVEENSDNESLIQKVDSDIDEEVSIETVEIQDKDSNVDNANVISQITDGNVTASTVGKTTTQRKKRFIDYEYNTMDPVIVKKVYLNKDYQYATFSVINSGFATLYMVNKKVVSNYKGKVVAVNAGHGVKGGSKKKTYSHPDFSPKVSGGTTKEGEIYSYAISDGMVFLNNMKESEANLLVAIKLRDKLLSEGYTVLMMREDENSHLDNIARVVIGNEYADCHLSIHFDSTANDKGIFYVKPVNNKDFLAMEPLKSNYDNIVKLGNCLIDAFREKNEKIWRNEGILQGDLTQIAFSTNASVDIELGDRATVVDDARADALADGLLNGVQKFFDLN